MVDCHHEFDSTIIHPGFWLVALPVIVRRVIWLVVLDVTSITKNDAFEIGAF
jgi:hypothetical protein